MAIAVTIAVLWTFLSATRIAPARGGESNNGGTQAQPNNNNSAEAREEEEAFERAEAFKATIEQAKDPVALAIPMAKDIFPVCAVAGLDVLVQHWQDPRSEATLADIAKGEPKYIREGFKTIAGEAHERLLLVRARKEFEKIMEGKNVPAEKLKAVRSVFEKHPDWLDPQTRPDDERLELVSMLISVLVDIPGGGDIVVQSRCLSLLRLYDYVQKHTEESVAYAEKMGLERILSTDYRFVEALGLTQDRKVIILFETWLKQAGEGWQKEALIYPLARTHGKPFLLKLLLDERPAVVNEAADCLERLFPDAESLLAVREALERRKKAGSDRMERAHLEVIIKRIEEKLAVDKNKEESK